MCLKNKNESLDDEHETDNNKLYRTKEDSLKKC